MYLVSQFIIFHHPKQFRTIQQQQQHDFCHHETEFHQLVITLTSPVLKNVLTIMIMTPPLKVSVITTLYLCIGHVPCNI